MALVWYGILRDCREISFVRCIVIYPVIYLAPFLLCQFDIIMPSLEQTHQFACIRVIFIWLKHNHITLATLTVNIRMQVKI